MTADRWYRYQCKCGKLVSSIFGFGMCSVCDTAAIYSVEKEEENE